LLLGLDWWAGFERRQGVRLSFMSAGLDQSVQSAASQGWAQSQTLSSPKLQISSGPQQGSPPEQSTMSHESHGQSHQPSLSNSQELESLQHAQSTASQA